MMAFLRSTVHFVWLLLTVVPYALFILGMAAAGVKGERLYWLAAKWLTMAIQSARVLMGIQYRITGMENLPTGSTSPVPKPDRPPRIEAPNAIASLSISL